MTDIATVQGGLCTSPIRELPVGGTTDNTDKEHPDQAVKFNTGNFSQDDLDLAIKRSMQNESDKTKSHNDSSDKMILGERTVKAPSLPRITVGSLFTPVQWQLYCTGAQVRG